MLTFDKTFEVIERLENFGGFLLLRQLKPHAQLVNYTDEIVIKDIIESKFHYWNGEIEPNGITIQLSSIDIEKKINIRTLADYKFYGFFDNSKIKTEHYKLISNDSFIEKLQNEIFDHSDNDKLFILKTKEVISRHIDSSWTIYFLDLDKNINSDIVAEWHVYDFFYAFIAINKQKSIITLIEFGLD